MKVSRYATSRKKACQQCSDSKARCDRKPEGCGRCAQRGLDCNYIHTLLPGASAQKRLADGDVKLNSTYPTYDSFGASACLFSKSHQGLPVGEDVSTSLFESGRMIDDRIPPINEFTTAPTSQLPHDPETDDASYLSRGSDCTKALDFTSLELVCPINADDISNRWLNAYIPVPGQVVKDYPTSVSAFIYRMLKSYAGVAVHDRDLPPFVHSSQLTVFTTSLSLSTCFSLIQVCRKPLRGDQGAVVDTLEQEMSNIYENHERCDDTNLVAAFQAYLIYAMVLFFQFSQTSNDFLRQAMMNLQVLASASSRRGLVCLAEQQRCRPRWEAWILAEANRRTLYTMYLFDSVLSTQDCLPTFLGTELRGLPAPASKSLWRAQARWEWEKAYDIHLTEWNDGVLRIDELWPIPEGLGPVEITERRSRVDRWLEDLDEYGTMLYAVTNGTHGG